MQEMIKAWGGLGTRQQVLEVDKLMVSSYYSSICNPMHDFSLNDRGTEGAKKSEVASGTKIAPTKSPLALSFFSIIILSPEVLHK